MLIIKQAIRNKQDTDETNSLAKSAYNTLQYFAHYCLLIKHKFFVKIANEKPCLVYESINYN